MTNKNEEKVVEDSIESVMEEQLKKNLKEVTAWIEEEEKTYYIIMCTEWKNWLNLEIIIINN